MVPGQLHGCSYSVNAMADASKLQSFHPYFYEWLPSLNVACSFHRSHLCHLQTDVVPPACGVLAECLPPETPLTIQGARSFAFLHGLPILLTLMTSTTSFYSRGFPRIDRPWISNTSLRASLILNFLPWVEGPK